MSKFRRVQTAFTTGELSETLRGRRDTQLYYLGLEEGLNILARPQGSAKVRPGAYVQRLIRASTAEDRNVRLAPFVFNAAQAYIGALTNQAITFTDIASGATQGAVTPFAGPDLDTVDWVQVADTMLMVQPDYAGIWEVARTPPDGFGSIWTEGAYAFERAPQYKYHTDRATTLAASGTSGSVTITAAGGANNAVFVSSDVGSIWSMAGVQFQITAMPFSNPFAPDFNPFVVTATILGTLPSAAATTNWTEAAASPKRGGFRSIAYAAGRLILGGTRSAPFRLWASRVGAPFDFLEGGTDASDPFSLDVTTGRADPILYVIAGSGGIEIFTEGGEGFIPSGPDSPVTPTTIAYVPQTSYGSRRIKPVRLDSQTIFAQRSGGAVREFVYSDVEQAYAAVPLTIRAQHLLSDPKRMTEVAGGFGLPVDFLLVANTDGTIACMTSLRSEEVTAWTPWRLARSVKDVQSVLSQVFVAVEDEGGGIWLERLDASAIFDSEVVDTAGTAKATWGPYLHLIGQEVSVFADGFWRGAFTVDSGGNVELDDDYSAVRVGFMFDVRVRPMPPEAEDQSLLGMPIRPYKVELSYLGSAALRVNGWVVPDRPFDDVITTMPTPATNVRRVYLRGWKRGKTQAPVVTRDGPFPFEILALAVDYRIGTG
jgi:hypothetical protein